MEKISGYFQFLALGTIVATSGILLLYGARFDAPIFDESAHIPAGYSYVRYFDYRLNHEHPPIVKMLSGLPLLFTDLKFPTESKAWTTDVNGQWRIGAQFLYESGNDAERLVFWARLGPVLLTLLTTVLIFFFARRFLGGFWALLPTTLFAFSPTVLAHGHFVTTDIGAAFGALFAYYYLFKYIDNSSYKNIALTGFAFGIAQLLKFSSLLLGPFFVLTLAVFCLAKAYAGSWPGLAEYLRRFFWLALRQGINLTLIFVIGFLTVYLVYLPLIQNYPKEMQFRDMQSVLPNFQPALKGALYRMTDVPLLRPFSQYFFGVFSVMQRAAYGNGAFFLGELSGKGWWYYFPVVYLLKEPIPILLLIAAAFLGGLKFARDKGRDLIKSYLGPHFLELAMLMYVVIYWSYSMTSPLNIGMRHIIPTLPFWYILAASYLKRWLAFPDFSKLPLTARQLGENIAKLPKVFARTLIAAVLVFWFLIEVALVMPNYMSYFNEFAGGTANGYRYVTDSNYDWGQDLYRLRDFVEKNDIQKIAVDYFGGGSPTYTLGDKTEGWWSSRGNPKNEGIEWLAISANTLGGALGTPLSDFTRKPEDEYRWLQDLRDMHEPDARAGYSIFIYKL